RRADTDGAGRRHRAGARGLAALSHRVDAARARDEHRHRDLPAQRRVLRPRSRLRSADPGAPRRRHRRRRERDGADVPRSRERADRGGGSVTWAVFFDVDFTLIYPGPTFRGEGYRRFGERHGLALDESKFGDAVRAAAPVLDAAQGDIYDPAIFHQYTASIIEAMGGSGPGVQPCAVEVYEEWALHHHFEMYDDVPDV